MILARGAARVAAPSFSTNPGMPSLPVALTGLTVCNITHTSLTETGLKTSKVPSGIGTWVGLKRSGLLGSLTIAPKVSQRSFREAFGGSDCFLRPVTEFITDHSFRWSLVSHSFTKNAFRRRRSNALATARAARWSVHSSEFFSILQQSSI